MEVNAQQLTSGSLLGFPHLVPTGPTEAQLDKTAQNNQSDSAVVAAPPMRRTHLKISFLSLETLKAVPTTFSMKFSESPKRYSALLPNSYFKDLTAQVAHRG